MVELTAPVATVWRTEEEVLQDDCDEVPGDDLSAEKGLVEGRNLAWLLAVVVGKTRSQQSTDNTQENGDGVTDRTGIKSVNESGDDKCGGVFTSFSSYWQCHSRGSRDPLKKPWSWWNPSTRGQ